MKLNAPNGAVPIVTPLPLLPPHCAPFRIGQRRDVQVHKFICTGMLEEMIDEMIERKKGLAESVVGNEEGWLTELSTADLRSLLALRPEAGA